MNLNKLRIAAGFWYLATPYTKFAGGIELAAAEAAKAAGALLEHKIPVFCPIAHSHYIAGRAGIDPLDHGFWLPADRPLMDAAHGLIVVTFPGWHDSYGVAYERQVFGNAKKPIVFLHPEDVGC